MNFNLGMTTAEMAVGLVTRAAGVLAPLTLLGTKWWEQTAYCVMPPVEGMKGWREAKWLGSDAVESLYPPKYLGVALSVAQVTDALIDALPIGPVKKEILKFGVGLAATYNTYTWLGSLAFADGIVCYLAPAGNALRIAAQSYGVARLVRSVFNQFVQN